MDIENRVKQIIADVLNLSVESIRTDASLKDDLGATSLDRYTILMDVEEAFSLNLDDVPEEDLDERIKTVADVLAMLNEHLKSD
jgi:acyl carrier protein